MCGIVGAIGKLNTNEIVLTGLQRLEYRGYDSCGIAFLNNNKIEINKSITRINDLKAQVTVKSNISLGHTRWATHGGVTKENAHPHISSDNNMVMVHNGVIENYKELKEKFCKDINFKSETDTEVILEVLNHFYNETKDLNEAIIKFMDVVDGSYACIIYLKDFENEIYALKNKSPMLIGKLENGFTISSDPTAVIDLTKEFYQIEDKKFIKMTLDNEIQLYNDKNEKEEIKFEIIDMDFEEISTENYDTFMLKEIEEQPKALRNLVENYKNIKISEELKTKLSNSKKIYIVASGTSYHSGLAMKKFIQSKLNIVAENVIGSEFGYDFNIIEENSFFIFLSQSGETADSMLVFNQVKGKYPILAITNVRGSQMDRNADYSLQIFAGIEVAVASTKAYTSQIAMLIILISEIVGDKNIYDKLLEVANFQEKVIEKKEEISVIADELVKHKEAFYLGRLVDYTIAQEAALKVKEISYINVSAFAAGELKHGTISLIDSDTIILSIINDKRVAANTRSSVEEVKARGGKVYTFSTTETAKEGDDFVIEYKGDEDLLPLIAIIPHQYLAYFSSKKLGLDVDKPRNLAKAVTVE